MSAKFSIGQMNQLGDALERAGFEPADVTALRNLKDLRALRALVRGQAEIVVRESRWREQDGVIYFSVTSDGTTGEDWITRLVRVDGYAQQVLQSPDFKPTNGVTTEAVVLRGCLFEDNDRTTEKIRAEADKRKLGKPNAEIACLIREKFTDREIEAMGLWWIFAMHEPINDAGGDPGLLGAVRDGLGGGLGAYCGDPHGQWDVDLGFAFAK